jgi:hypothetical protein
LKKLDFGQTVSVIANIGVIAGIVFLGYELSQNNEQLSAQARYNYYHERIEAQRIFARNGELSDLAARFFLGEELSPGERLRIQFVARAIFITIEYEFIELQRGRITIEEFNLAGKRGTFERLKPFWAEHRSIAPNEFVEFVESKILR